MCASSYRVVGCLSVKIQAIETVDNNTLITLPLFVNTFSYYPKHTGFYLVETAPERESDNKHKAACVGKYSEGLPKSL